MRDQVTLEICVDSVESAIAAEKGGAHRIELCSDLFEGGITPSAGLISVARNKVSIDLFVMIRPSGGDFLYTPEEFETMEQDVLMAKRLGANGVVFGMLHEDGEIDKPRTRRLVDIARPLKATFHRAFDMSRDLHSSLAELVEAGVDRVLTSGGEQKAEDGIANIAKLVKTANGKLQIMAGSGITETNVHHIIEQTGVREIHASARVHLPSPMRHRNERISMGAAQGREYQRAIVLQEKVARLLEAARQSSEQSRRSG